MPRQKRPELFNAVLGRGRGRQEADTILSNRPSESGREDLAALIEEMGVGNFEKSLALLAAHRQLISGRPLLRKLAGEFCQRLVGQSAITFDDAVRHFLDATGIYPAAGGHLLTVSPQSRVQGQTSSSSRRTVHVWPQGGDIGPLACLEAPSSTVCGLEVTKAAWRRADRGTWNADLASLRWQTCEICSRQCPAELRYVLDESGRYVPLGGVLYGRMIGAITQKTVQHIQTRPFSTVEDAREIANSAYHEMLLPAAVTYALQGKEATVQWVLDARRWRALCSTHGSEISPLLSSDDWKDALSPCVPKLIDGEIETADESVFAGARTDIADALAERAGGLTPAELSENLERRQQASTTKNP